MKISGYAQVSDLAVEGGDRGVPLLEWMHLILPTLHAVLLMQTLLTSN